LSKSILLKNPFDPFEVIRVEAIPAVVVFFAGTRPSDEGVMFFITEDPSACKKYFGTREEILRLLAEQQVAREELYGARAPEAEYRPYYGRRGFLRSLLSFVGMILRGGKRQ
jgi:hypothetical protein